MTPRRPRLRRLALAAALLALACGPRGEDGPADGSAAGGASGAGPVRLRVFPRDGAEPHFEIAPEACPDADDPVRGCPFAVTLVDGERVRARARLEWANAVGLASLGPPDASAGAGDPFDPDALEYEVPEALYTGDEANAVTTVARPLALGSGTPGLLIDQLAGFEHLKRAHFLFAVSGEQLVQAWSYEEPAGPTWSTTALATVGAGRQAVVLISGLSLGIELGDRPDEIETQVVSWDPDSGRAAARTGSVPILAVVMGRFPRLEEARQVYDAHPECLVDFWLLAAGRLALPGDPGDIVLALLGVSEAGARTRLEEAIRCSKDLEGSLATLRP